MAENNWKQMLFQHPTVIWMQVGQEAAFSTKPPSTERAGIAAVAQPESPRSAVLHTPACPPPTSRSPVK